MLGGALLVAPIFAPQGTVSYYLPAGRWTSLITGERVDGGGWRTERHDYMSLPLMARPNSIVAFGAEENRPDYDFARDVTFHLFELDDGGTATATVCNTHGEEELAVHAERSGLCVAVTTRGARKPWRMQLRNVTRVAGVKGGTAREAPSGVMITPDSPDQAVTVTLSSASLPTGA
jgi:alpha-D-xyloside xylohydrolase